MSDAPTILRVVLSVAAFAGFCWLLVALVRGARRGGKGAMGAMLIFFSWGHMRDPGNDTVAEAKDGRATRGTHSGDPPDPDPR